MEMETVKRLVGDEFQTLKHEIEVHCGRDSAHTSEDPKKLQVSESHEQENKPEPLSSTIHVDSGLQHADLSSVLAKEDVKVESKSVSKSNNGIVTATAAAEEIHTAKVTHSTHDDSKKKTHEGGQVQVQVQDRAFQILARGAKAPTVKSGSPGQHH